MTGNGVLKGFDIWMAVIQVSLMIMLILAVFMIIYSLQPLDQRYRRMYAARNLTYLSKHKPMRILQRLLRIPHVQHASYQEIKRLLSACGWRIEPGLYIMFKRLMLIFAVGIAVLTAVYGYPVLSATSQVAVLSVAGLMILLAITDKQILDKLRLMRRYRVMRDVDVISRQLLYYSGLSTNLHGKLLRCLPFTKALRSEWYQLTSEWYQNAEIALKRFQERVATEEGSSFAETLRALRQYDHDRYYELLKQRIADYKEKLELFKETRKESLSYLLFVISGIPILFTFRLFVYPWVAEGQKLFDSLG